VNADERSEIAASLAAHAELGPQYDAAVAEGLVERIGAEIDKRIDARLRNAGHQAQPAQPSPPPPSHPVPGHAVPPLLMPHPMQQQMPPAPAPQQFLQQPRELPAHRSSGATIASVILALGSMGMGIGATAVVATHLTGGAGFVIFLIWLAIVMVNGLHARFYWRPDDHHRGHKG
jgi:hypothetical protein